MTCATCQLALDDAAAFCGYCGRALRARRDSLVGQLLDERFDIVGRIALGGFGAIYCARDLHTGELVALKVLRAELARDARLGARFRREASTLAALHSAHTVAVRAIGCAPDGTRYIAMELLQGESLLDRMRRTGAMPWRRALRIVRGICASLAEAHALGIVHRDLKPANIHLETRGSDPDFVKVLDFGVAKLVRGTPADDGSELTFTGQAIGTLEYMAPEQLVGDECDGRTDIYTLGVLAYELVTGRRPYADAATPTSLMTAVLTQDAVAPSRWVDVPPVVDALLLQCLARDPDERFASVPRLADALEVVLAPPLRAVA